MKPSKPDKSSKTTERIVSVSLNAEDVARLDVVRAHLATDAITTAFRFALKETAQRLEADKRRPRKP